MSVKRSPRTETRWLEAAAAQGHRRASLELALLQAPPEPQVLEPVDAEEAAGADRDDQPSIVPIFEDGNVGFVNPAMPDAEL